MVAYRFRVYKVSFRNIVQRLTMIAKSFLLFLALFTSELEGLGLRYKYDDLAKAWLKLHSTPATWREARSQCESEGAVLATPVSSRLRDAISHLVSLENQAELTIHFGEYTRYSSNSFFYLEGEHISSLPVAVDPENCVAWDAPSLTMRRIKCTDRLPFVCYKNASVEPCGTSLDYTYNTRSGSCYKFHKESKNWDDAHNTCRAEGTDLAVVNSDIEAVVLQNIFVMNVVVDGNRRVAFIGLRDRQDGKSWMTVDGISLAETAFRWESNEPNNARGNEYCGTIDKSGRLNDDPCNENYPFICEKKSGI